jgi:hypothetical protein
MHDPRDDLNHLGLQRNGLWVADARIALSPGYIADLERATQSVELAPGVPLLLGDASGLDLSSLQNVVRGLIGLFEPKHSVCVCETTVFENERSFQFESGLALVFVHLAFLKAPFAGFAHEFTHAMGLTGIAEIDEGLSMLFDEATAGGAVDWSPSCRIDRNWCADLARRQVSPANIYTFGSSYFASIVETDGETALLEERERLRNFENAKAVREHMRLHLIAVRSRNAACLDGEITTEILDDLYFRGDLGAFKSGSDALFAQVDPGSLSKLEQLTYCRYINYLATLEAEEIPDSILKVLQDECEISVSHAAMQFLGLARAVFRTRRSQSRIALKKNARKLERGLMEALKTDAIKADVLLQLVQFHKYVPEIAGGQSEKALSFASELAALPGMQSVGRELCDGIQRGYT